ncbi:MAG: hypothetical protein EZS28_005441 [Streblomastix strix]|uniref:Uncharacterized protein n=1 Tax=Streblomastix strix TaxID=222440 RepID=A0A5J4WVI6_9EUKA|nr:MAG: hypothetical protein EZS28_005441 [Streblomastix strix]
MNTNYNGVSSLAVGQPIPPISNRLKQQLSTINRQLDTMLDHIEHESNSSSYDDSQINTNSHKLNNNYHTSNNQSPILTQSKLQNPPMNISVIVHAPNDTNSEIDPRFNSQMSHFPQRFNTRFRKHTQNDGSQSPAAVNSPFNPQNVPICQQSTIGDIISQTSQSNLKSKQLNEIAYQSYFPKGGKKMVNQNKMSKQGYKSVNNQQTNQQQGIKPTSPDSLQHPYIFLKPTLLQKKHLILTGQEKTLQTLDDLALISHEMPQKGQIPAQLQRKHEHAMQSGFYQNSLVCCPSCRYVVDKDKDVDDQSCNDNDDQIQSNSQYIVQNDNESNSNTSRNLNFKENKQFLNVNTPCPLCGNLLVLFDLENYIKNQGDILNKEYMKNIGNNNNDINYGVTSQIQYIHNQNHKNSQYINNQHPPSQYFFLTKSALEGKQSLKYLTALDKSNQQQLNQNQQNSSSQSSSQSSSSASAQDFIQQSKNKLKFKEFHKSQSQIDKDNREARFGMPYVLVDEGKEIGSSIVSWKGYKDFKMNQNYNVNDNIDNLDGNIYNSGLRRSDSDHYEGRGSISVLESPDKQNAFNQYQQQQIQQQQQQRVSTTSIQQNDGKIHSEDIMRNQIFNEMLQKDFESTAERNKMKKLRKQMLQDAKRKKEIELLTQGRGRPAAVIDAKVADRLVNLGIPGASQVNKAFQPPKRDQQGNIIHETPEYKRTTYTAKQTKEMNENLNRPQSAGSNKQQQQQTGSIDQMDGNGYYSPHSKYNLQSVHRKCIPGWYQEQTFIQIVEDEKQRQGGRSTIIHGNYDIHGRKIKSNKQLRKEARQRRRERKRMKSNWKKSRDRYDNRGQYYEKEKNKEHINRLKKNNNNKQTDDINNGEDEFIFVDDPEPVTGKVGEQFPPRAAVKRVREPNFDKPLVAYDVDNSNNSRRGSALTTGRRRNQNENGHRRRFHDDQLSNLQQQGSFSSRSDNQRSKVGNRNQNRSSFRRNTLSDGEDQYSNSGLSDYNSSGDIDDDNDNSSSNSIDIDDPRKIYKSVYQNTIGKSANWGRKRNNNNSIGNNNNNNIDSILSSIRPFTASSASAAAYRSQQLMQQSNSNFPPMAVVAFPSNGSASISSCSIVDVNSDRTRALGARVLDIPAGKPTRPHSSDHDLPNQLHFEIPFPKNEEQSNLYRKKGAIDKKTRMGGKITRTQDQNPAEMAV